MGAKPFSRRRTPIHVEDPWEGLPAFGTPDQERQDLLLKIERSVIKVRWFASIFAVAQILTFYRPYPAGVKEAAFAALGVLIAGNIAMAIWIRRIRDVREAVRVSVAGLVLDCLATLAFVWVYTFDPDTSIWAILYLVPLEGARRFGLRGAVLSMSAVAFVYALREAYGTAVFGNEFFVTSITFRMGIGFFIAFVSGLMASDLAMDRRRLGASNDRYRALLDALGRTGQGFVVVDPPKILYVNEATVELGEYSADELVSVDDFMRFVEPEDHEKSAQAIAEALTTGRPVHHEVKARTKSGRLVDIEVSIQRLGPDGTTRLVGILRDVTARKKVQGDIVRQRSLLEQAERLALMGSWEWDLRTRQFRASAELSEIYGWQRGSSPSSPLSLLQSVPDEERALVAEAMHSAMNDYQGFALDHRIVTDGDVRIVHAVAEVIKDDEGVPSSILGTTQDVTELHRAQRELEVAIARERDAIKALREEDAVKSDFLSAVAHELRTPLTSLQGFSSTLVKRSRDLDEATRDEFIRRMDSAAGRLTQIVEELLDFSRLEHRAIQLDMESVDLLDIVQATLHDMSGVLGDHTVRVDIAEQMIYADPRALRRVLENLIGNAAKFSPRGTSVDVRAEPGGDEVVIIVEDEGIGIPEDQVDRIFERFHRVHRGNTAPSGAGIGLTLARQLVEAHGGRIWAAKRDPAGARFSFTLPSRVEAGAPAPTESLS